MKKSIKAAIIILSAGVLLTSFAVFKGYREPIDSRYIFNSKGNILKNTKKLEANSKFKNIKKINMDISNYDVHFQPSNDSDVSIEYDEFRNKKSNDLVFGIRTEEKNGILELIQVGEIGGFGFAFYPDKSSTKLVVNIPKDLELSIVNHTGDISIEGTKANSMKIKNDVGDISMKNAELNSLTVDSNVGDVSIYKSKLNDSNITLDIGDINFENADSRGLSVKTSTGDLSYAGSVSGLNKLETFTGDIKICLDQEKSSVGLVTSTQVGDIRMDSGDVKYDDDKSKFKDHIEVKTDVGDIDIKFKK